MMQNSRPQLRKTSAEQNAGDESLTRSRGCLVAVRIGKQSEDSGDIDAVSVHVQGQIVKKHG